MQLQICWGMGCFCSPGAITIQGVSALGQNGLESKLYTEKGQERTDRIFYNWCLPFLGEDKKQNCQITFLRKFSCSSRIIKFPSPYLLHVYFFPHCVNHNLMNFQRVSTHVSTSRQLEHFQCSEEHSVHITNYSLIILP